MNDDPWEPGMPMTRLIIQSACVLAIALGAGLWAFGSYLRPDYNAANPAKLMSDGEIWFSASVSGAGIGFITFGSLGLAIPWVNALVNRQRPTPESAPVAGQIGASA